MRLTAIALVLCAAAPAVRADEIHLFNGKPRKGVTIVDETFEEISFKMPGVRVTQTLRADQVKEVVHESWPEKYRIALETMGAGDFKRASLLFQAEAGNPPRSRKWIQQYAFFNAAECQRAQRDFDGAIKLYDKLLKTVPKTRFFGDSYLRKAQCYLSKGDSSRAKSTFQDLRDQVGAQGLPERWDAVAQFHIVKMDESKDPQAAFDAYMKLQERAAGLEAFDVANMARLRIGRVLISQDKIDEARKYFQGIIDNRQASDTATVAGAYNGLGRTYVAKSSPSEEEYNRAMYSFMRTVFKYGDELAGMGDQDMVPEALYWTARCLEVRKDNIDGNSKRARVLYTRVMKEYPSSNWAKLASER